MLPAKMDRRYSSDIVRPTSTVEQVAHSLKAQHYAIPKRSFRGEAGNSQFNQYMDKCAQEYNRLHAEGTNSTVSDMKVDMQQHGIATV